MEKILVLTDFSKVAYHASLYAIKLACQIHAEIHFLHTISTPVDWRSMRRTINIHHPLVKEQLEKAEAGLKELEDLSQKEGAIAKSFIGYNKENFDLVEHVKEYNLDYVVTGSHGAKGAKELFFGSNAQRIIRHAPCPTLNSL